MFAKRLVVEVTPSSLSHSVEDAQAAVKSLNHPEIKFGLDSEEGLGSYSAKGGSAFTSWNCCILLLFLGWDEPFVRCQLKR